MKDGLLQDPRLCNFDPNILQCKGEDHPDCLTAAQVVVVRAFYSPTVNPRTREQIFPGMVPGSELGRSSNTGRMYADPPDIPKTLATAYLRYAVFQDPNWDYMTFDFDSGMALADRIDDGLTKASDPNLRDFFQLGGRLLQYHGWSDPSISPLNSINYYDSVLDFRGGPINVRASSDSSWFLGWTIATRAMARTLLIRSAQSKNGSRLERRRKPSSLLN